METIISNQGAKRAVEEYHRMKKDTGQFYTDWLSMDYLGYQLFTLKSMKKQELFMKIMLQSFLPKALC